MASGWQGMAGLDGGEMGRGGWRDGWQVRALSRGLDGWQCEGKSGLRRRARMPAAGDAGATGEGMCAIVMACMRAG